jgi:hypothetical protein
MDQRNEPENHGRDTQTKALVSHNFIILKTAADFIKNPAETDNSER